MPDEGTTNIQCEYPGCLAAAVDALRVVSNIVAPQILGWYCAKHLVVMVTAAHQMMAQWKREQEAHP